MNKYGFYYNVCYRLDDIQDYDATEYSEDLNTKKGAEKYARDIIKKYGDRVVLLDIYKYDDDELVDSITII